MTDAVPELKTRHSCPVSPAPKSSRAQLWSMPKPYSESVTLSRIIFLSHF